MLRSDDSELPIADRPFRQGRARSRIAYRMIPSGVGRSREKNQKRKFLWLDHNAAGKRRKAKVAEQADSVLAAGVSAPVAKKPVEAPGPGGGAARPVAVVVAVPLEAPEKPPPALVRATPASMRRRK